MNRPFNLLERIGDAIQCESRSTGAQISSHDFEGRRPRSRLLGQQASPKCFVDDITKRPAGPTRLGLQLCGYIVIERQGRTHICMLSLRHYDV